jgi:hypothetical protein
MAQKNAQYESTQEEEEHEPTQEEIEGYA